jgi:hypothetical protein
MAGMFLELVEKVLKGADRPLSPAEIWATAQDMKLDKGLATKGKTPHITMAAQLYVDVRDNPDSLFASAGSSPKRFYLRTNALAAKNVDAAPPAVQPTKSGPAYTERQLHPFLAYFGHFYLRASVKTINHSKSTKKDFGEWVHPDIVGCYFPFGDWKKEVVEVSGLLGGNAFRVYSFEVKRILTFANLRAAFFQAVSNSSWANEAYLVAADISDDNEFHTELERLSTAFGVGIIHLDVEDPDASRVMMPARTRDNIDWETANKLATMNPDFAAFLKRVKNDIQAGEVTKELYDGVLSPQQLADSIKA